MMKNTTFLLFCLLLISGFALAQDDEGYTQLNQGSVSFRAGGFFPQGESDLWEENVDTFTMEVEDFKGITAGVEVNWFLNDFLTVGLAVDFYTKSVDTEYRDFIGDDGAPILQEIELQVVPVTATIKLTPLGNGSPDYAGNRDTPFVPWIGGGLGIYPYRYEETGEFIDFEDDSIFPATFLSEEEVGFGAHVAGGVVVPIGYKWDVFGEARYAWVEADLSEDFLGFDPIDLGGFSFFFGASYRY